MTIIIEAVRKSENLPENPLVLSAFQGDILAQVNRKLHMLVFIIMVLYCRAFLPISEGAP